MKRYIYTMLSALLLFSVGCDFENGGTTEPKPVVGFIFGSVEVEATDTTAVVDVLAYITVDGVKYEGTKLSVEYWAGGDSANMKSVTEYVEVGDNGRVAFTISDLTENTRYYANIVCDGGKKYGVQRKEFTFATRKTITQSISCNANVVTKGLFATINLSDVAYMLNDDPQKIASLKLEYARHNSNAWTVVDVAGNSIKNGNVSIAIPKSGDDYLEENTDYVFFVTLTPVDSDLESIMSNSFEFKTSYAVITANIAKPQLKYNDEGITIKAGSIAVYYDGVESDDYTSHIYFREQGTNLWEEYTLSVGDTVVIPSEQLKENTRYEAKVSIVAGAQSQVRESGVATVTTSMGDTPVVPTPPMGGDTSSIAGVWHLTSWRGATPSFDVYMDITATGGITLYQRIDSRYWDVYQSSANIENGVISGVYTDNVVWGASYSLSVAEDTMTWVSTSDSSDVSVYTRSSLPSNMPTAPTRATVASERFL